MLTNEAMGVLALAILWVNALLVAADAARQARALLRRRAELRVLGAGEPGLGLVRGVVGAGGAGGTLARVLIEQVGRAGGCEGTILFQDRAARGEVMGGTIAEAGGGELTVEAGPTAEVWLTPCALTRAAGCASTAAFDEAYPCARKAKGFARAVEVEVRAGQEVWVFGEVRAVGEGRTIAPILVATMSPRALLAQKAALGAGFLVGELVVAAACTAVALASPVFGRVSTAGGVLCLGFFLLVQPASAALRGALLVPSRAPLRGRWTQGVVTAEAEARA